MGITVIAHNQRTYVNLTPAFCVRQKPIPTHPYPPQYSDIAMVTPSPPAASDIKTSYDRHTDGARTSLDDNDLQKSNDHHNRHIKPSYENNDYHIKSSYDGNSNHIKPPYDRQSNDNLSAAYDDLQQHRVSFMKPETLEELLGHRVNFYNGTHVLCARNTSLPPALNGSDIQCLYGLPPLPKELYFSDDSAVSVIAYSCLFLVAACGNLTVFITLFRNRGVKSRVNMFIMHLAIADLLVTFMMLPLEIAWHATVAWLAGDAMCRLMMFFRAFGFYLSSCILVTISLDRYFAIMHPLSISDATRRGKIMLGFSWAFSVVSSIPQVGGPSLPLPHPYPSPLRPCPMCSLV